MKKIDNKGITIVALVITIIVLLILAAITIGTLTGENGIVTKAVKAQEEKKKAQYKEAIELVIIEKQIQESRNQNATKPFIEVVKEGIEKKKWEWVDIVYIVDDDLTEVLDSINGTHLLVETKEGYEIIVKIDNALKIGEVIEIGKINKEKWKITFDLDGGSGEKPKEIEVRKGWSVRLPTGENLSKTEYKFVGQSTIKNGEIIEGRYTPETNVTLYAVWKKDTVAITLKGNGAEQPDIIKNVVKNQEVTLTADFERSGYQLIGWSTSSDGNVEYTKGQIIKAEQNMTLYAQWAGEVLVALSLTKGNNEATQDLTSGTNINIAVTSPTADINNLTITIGNITVYNNEETGRSLNKSIPIDNLSNLIQLISFQTYEVTAIATNQQGVRGTATKTGITNLTIKSYEDLVAFSNCVNDGNNLWGRTVYLIRDLNLTGKKIDAIGKKETKPFMRNL